jgi:hypothetical protein
MNVIVTMLSATHLAASERTAQKHEDRIIIFTHYPSKLWANSALSAIKARTQWFYNVKMAQSNLN